MHTLISQKYMDTQHAAFFFDEEYVSEEDEIQTGSCPEESSDLTMYEDNDIEGGHDNSKILSKINPNRIIYSLRKLKKIKSLFYVKQAYLKWGYRANPNMSICMCTKTAFMVHNETFNFWTHVVGALYYIY